MISIGITGGVGAGKSAILNYLKTKYDARVFLADEIAHILEAKGMDCYNKLVCAFGKDILGEDEEIDKRKFASVIFSDEDKLKQVNDIIHPAVREYIIQLMENEKNAGTQIFVLEAALLIECGYSTVLDEIWYIYASQETRSKRLRESRGYSDEKIASIMESQLSEQEFRNGSKRVVNNDGNVENAFAEIDEYIRDLMGA